MTNIYFTFQKQHNNQTDLLSLYDAINSKKDIATESRQGYNQFCTLLLNSIENIKATPIVNLQTKTLIPTLARFANHAEKFINATEPNKHYYNFKIPKASGGLRLINAPEPELKKFLATIKDFLQDALHILPHNAAHAYTRNRSTITALQRHQHNKSKWFLKIDLKDFFPSCTEEFIHKQLEQIFPLCLMYHTESSKEVMNKIVRAACFNYGEHYGLPQGTPLSPYLTNILMIPIDYEIHNLCRQWQKQHFVYTRYADDILISSKYEFDYKTLENEIKNIIAKYAPFNINSEKTRYGSAAGRNWNLGLMLNDKNEITIGYRRKRDIKQKLLNYCAHPSEWTLEDLQSFHGELAYFLHIEPDYAEHLIAEYSKKYNSNINILEQIQENLK